MTMGELRWIYVTLSVSIITSGFLSLTFKKTTEKIPLVIGRTGIAVLGGTFGTKLVAIQWDLAHVEEDVIILGAYTVGITMLSFFFGYQMLRLFDRKGSEIVEIIFDKWKSK